MTVWRVLSKTIENPKYLAPDQSTVMGVTLEGKEEGSLKAKRSWLVRDATKGTLVTSAKQHKLASD